MPFVGQGFKTSEICLVIGSHRASLMAQQVKNLPATEGDTRDMGSIPGGGRSPGAGNGNPLQYICLENPMAKRRLVSYSLMGHNESDMAE